MDPACFNTYHNINYRQRSQTLQHFRGGALEESKRFIMAMYFNSQDPDRAKYANVHHHEQDEQPLSDAHLLHQPIPRHHNQYAHSRSRSQHHYHTMCQANDPTNYYNLSNFEQTIIPAQSKHVSPINEPLNMHNTVAPLDSIRVMQVCTELGYDLDSNPKIPPSRNYTISVSRGCAFKSPFPQRRFVKELYTDPVSGQTLTPDTLVTILGVSKRDRSKFGACFNDQHVEIPHRLTQQ